MEMTARQVLDNHYNNSPFDSPFEDHTKTYKAYLGPFMIDVPNTDERKRLVIYHDLHHLIAGYDNSRIGEGEIGAWELGTGLWRRPFVMFLNWGGMATGIYYAPKRTYRAFMLGVSCRALYRFKDEQAMLNKPYSELQEWVRQGKSSPSFYHLCRFVFFTLGCVAMLAVSPFAYGVTLLRQRFIAN